jgi:hypothetical protein
LSKITKNEIYINYYLDFFLIFFFGNTSRAEDLKITTSEGVELFVNINYYWNFKPLAGSVEVPVLFFYGSNDHSVGVKHYKEINFPNMMLYRYKGSHVPFIEGMADLEKAISAFIKKFKFTI